MNEHYIPAGQAARRGFAVSITPEEAGWRQCGIHVLGLASEQSRELDTGDAEWLAIPLDGGFVVEAEGVEYQLRGRPNVFAGPTDVIYLPRDTSFTISAVGGGRVAFAAARTDVRLEVQFLRAEDAPIARRGAGNMSRKAHEYINGAGLGANKLLALEVYTPGGNWSSYPPHKHDVDTDDETQLEEIYYFEVADGPEGPGFAYQRAYASDDRPIDVLAEVRTGDVVLIPYGWHGPAIAPPGFDLYYLNVMSGSGDANVWKFSNEPETAWIRDGWEGLDLDPRVL
ncbi:MAG: 5-deoxy-glucuronate isomerase [Propionibacteriaceae bacterium]|nr:5-deoxy-glucuronate isomerase [Propionibacteriaceae bacterium]